MCYNPMESNTLYLTYYSDLAIRHIFFRN